MYSVSISKKKIEKNNGKGRVCFHSGVNVRTAPGKAENNGL